MDPELLAEQRETLPPAVYARLFDNVWTAGSGDALSPEWIERAVVLSGPLSGREFGWRFTAGLDLSTRRDFSALVVVGKHVGGLKRRVDGGEAEPVSRVGRILDDIGELVGEPGDDWRRLLGARSRAGAEYEDTAATGKLRLATVELWKPTRGQIELFPFVEVLDVPRGSTIEGATIGTPTVVWNNSEGTAQDLFNTASLVGPLSHTIHPVAVFLEVGRDLLADAPVDIGRILVAAIGERFAAELDKVIAVGDGTTQPEGIFTASAGNVVDSANGTDGPLAVEDFEGLAFGIAKQYRTPAMAPSFILNDATYRRGRTIPSALNWNTRAMGFKESDYSLIEWPARIQNDIPETSIGFMPLRKYRMYRRAGLEIRWTDQGMTLARQNTILLICRARYGGFVTDTDALATMVDAPTVLWYPTSG